MDTHKEHYGKAYSFRALDVQNTAKVSTVDRFTNVELMKVVRTDKKHVNTTKSRKISYFVHGMRHTITYNILHLVFQGKIQGRCLKARRGIGLSNQQEN